MIEDFKASNFDSSRAELFEALGHPIRMKILESLGEAPLGFSDLKRRVGIESSGHLQFHLSKLDGLVKTDLEGNYELTDDGREILRILETMKRTFGNGVKQKGSHRHTRVIIPVILIIAIIVLAVFSAYQIRYAEEEAELLNEQLCWIKPGSYAFYALSTDFVVRLNEKDYLVVKPDSATVAYYGFQIVDVEDGYALLRIWFNESTILPSIFNTSCLSCLVWIDLDTRNLVDRETGEVWGKCPFWIYPSEAGRKDVVAISDFLGERIVWEEMINGRAWIGPLKSFGLIQAIFPRTNLIRPTTFTINASYSFHNGKIVKDGGILSFLFFSGPFFCNNYHAEKGLLLSSLSPYADDVLIKKFGVVLSHGQFYMPKPEYLPKELHYGTMIIYDTNIIRRMKQAEGGFPIPLADVMVVAILAVYYIYLKRESMSSFLGF